MLEFILQQGPISIILFPHLELVNLLNLRKCSKELSRHIGIKKEIEGRVLDEYFGFVPKYYLYDDILSRITDLELREKFSAPHKNGFCHVFTDPDIQQFLLKEGFRYGDVIYNRCLYYPFICIVLKNDIANIRHDGTISSHDIFAEIRLNKFYPGVYKCRCSPEHFVNKCYCDPEDLQQIKQNFNPLTGSFLDLDLRYGVKIRYFISKIVPSRESDIPKIELHDRKPTVLYL